MLAAEKRSLIDLCSTGAKQDFRTFYRKKKMKLQCLICDFSTYKFKAINKYIIASHLGPKLKKKTEADEIFNCYKNTVFDARILKSNQTNDVMKNVANLEKKMFELEKFIKESGKKT